MAGNQNEHMARAPVPSVSQRVGQTPSQAGANNLGYGTPSVMLPAGSYPTGTGNTQYVPVSRGSNGYIPWSPNQADMNTVMWQWQPASVVGGPTYLGGYFTGSSGSAYNAELLRWAKTIHPMSSQSTLWEDMVDQSAYLAERGIFLTPYELVESWAANGGGPLALGGSSGGGGGGGYYRSYGGGGYGGGGGGSSTSISLTNREDARAIIDSLAMRMIGRNVNNKEFDEYYEVMLNAQRTNPTRVSMDSSGAVVQEGGITQAGMERVLENALRSNEDFAENAVGAQMVGMFQKYLADRGVFSG